MSHMPKWMSELIEKGSSVTECLEMWRQEQEAMRAERDQARAERETVRAEKEAERELEKVRLAHEREERQAKRDRDKWEAEKEIKLRELALKEKELEKSKTGPSPQSIHTPSVKLPKFEEGQDPDVFLKSFEKIAGLQKWDQSQWAVRLVPMLSGKALEAYSRLSDEDSDNYDAIKTAILKRYELTSEAYRDKFRQCRQSNDESFKDFVVRTERFFNHWCEREEIGSNFHKLFDLMLREQVIRSCSKELQLWVLEHSPKSIKEVITLSESFQVAHKGSNSGVGRGNAGEKPGARPNKFGSVQSQKGKFISPSDQRRCFKCDKVGHIAPNCPLRKVQSKSPLNQKPGNHKSNEQFGLCLDETMTVSEDSDSVHENKVVVKLSGVSITDDSALELSCETGLDLVSGEVGGHVVSVLRDTGCSTVFVNSKLVSDEDKTGKSRVITLADGTRRSCSEAIVSVNTPYISGKVHALCLDSPFADVIIGNNVSIVVPKEADPLPRMEKVDTVEDDACGAVQTRSELRKQERAEKPKLDDLKASNTENEGMWCNREELIEHQKTDESLKSILDMAQNGPYEGKSYFILKNDLLYRVFEKNSDEKVFQIVAPKKLRNGIMSLAHDTPLAGHLGNKKTRERILQNFFWPGMYVDISRYCKSCSICQKGMQKGRTPKAKLVPIPKIDVPFSRVAIDFVGPLPMTEKKNRYILVCMDYATRFPEAFPMKTQDAESVANALMEMFSRVGFPKEILSDQGTNFMSSLISNLCKMLKVRKLSTTPYHPQANGLVERFNGTLKQMLKAYAVVEPLKWDVHLPYVLFAYRDVPNETTGFTPFELLYARHVRGPLDILKEQWEEPTEEQASVLSYLIETRERMETVRKLVTEVESQAKKKQKRYYDKNARSRNFEVGQKVLVLLPTSTSKLLAQWKGPYEVTEKVSPVDFRVRVSKNKETVYHVNMLKEWFERESEENSKSEIMACLNVISSLSSNDVQIEDGVVSDKVPALQQTESSADVLYSKDLNTEQRDQIQRLVEEFGDIFTDVPKKTPLTKHSVKTSTDVPIHMKPYPIPYALQDQVKRELQQMMDLGIIEETDSPYSAPVVLIKKSDKSLRFCVDFRELNNVTVFDPRPMPRIDDILIKISKAKFISKLDLTKGYWQVPLDEDAKRKSAFVTPFGHFSFSVMPFGMVNAPATFVRLVSKVLTGLEDFTEAFIDDIGIYSDSWTEHLEHLRTVFSALRKANLAARPTKCEFGFNELCFLGHTVGSGKIKPMMSKVESIQNFPIPTTKKKVKSFLGMIGFYRKFIPNFATLALPLTDLTSKKTPSKIKWTSELDHSFQELKGKLLSEPVLRSPDFSRSFILRTDASAFGAGAVLEQEFEDGKHPICFLSKKFSPAERNYAVVEKECFAIVWAVQSLRVYLEGKPFKIETDHAPLQWLQRSKLSNQRLLRWSLLLQEFVFSIRYIRGTQNTVADSLSRLCSDDLAE
ncbi:uncharacterized protein LOC134246689 [Saccostrea cucullata]|uniref:uncharacterized protein LOC134246689 n=1 Tax=Saccostrea cuccullata TaxID=36930 RepID=UPI002ED06A47